MTNIMRAIVVVSLIFVSNLSFADDHSNDQLVQTLMQKSGLEKQIEQVPQFVQSGLDKAQQEARGLSQEAFRKISVLAISAFDARAIHEAVTTYIKSTLSENDMSNVLVWLKSPLGKKITRLEEEATTPEKYMDMQARGPKLLDEYKDTARIIKLEKLDNVIGATESTVSTVLNVQLALIAAMSTAMEADKRPFYEDVQDLVYKNKTQVQASINSLVRMQFLYTYSELTDYEIDRYVEFAESNSGQRYHYVTTNALNDALVQAARKFGSRIGMRMNRI